MESENPNVGTLATEGAPGNQPVVSQEAGKPIDGAPQQSQELSDIKKQLELTMKELKGLQSRQDKEKNEVQRFMDEVKQKMANGLSLDEAERAVNEERNNRQKDDLLYKMAAKLGVLDGSTPTQVAGNSLNVSAEAARVFEKAQVNPNSPEATELIRRYGDDPVTLAVELGSLKAKLGTSNPPSPASAPSMPATPTQPADGNALVGEYRNKVLAARNNPAEVRRLKEEYRQKGTPVDQIIF